jgi:hypothetical protein
MVVSGGAMIGVAFVIVVGWAMVMVVVIDGENHLFLSPTRCSPGSYWRNGGKGRESGRKVGNKRIKW